MIDWLLADTVRCTAFVLTVSIVAYIIIAALRDNG